MLSIKHANERCVDIVDFNKNFSTLFENVIDLYKKEPWN